MLTVLSLAGKDFLCQQRESYLVGATTHILRALNVTITTMNENKQPDLLDSIAGTAVLLLVLVLVAVVIGGIPFLIFEGIARLALPVPSGATPELQQSVARQRELLVRGLFFTSVLLFCTWWMLTH